MIKKEQTCAEIIQEIVQEAKETIKNAVSLRKIRAEMRQNMRKTAFLFPGQGAQNVGMGRSFYEKYDAVRQYFKTAQEVTGIDVASLCFEENEALNQTEYTQIAMYTTDVRY